MSDPHQRPLTLDRALWAKVDEDAKRCKRSGTKQIEAILQVYYGLANVELRDLTQTRKLVSPDLPAPGPHSLKKQMKA